MLHTRTDSSLADALSALRATRWMGARVRAFATTGSTNDEAARWAREGAPSGALVLADAQTAGRGRHRRAWTAEPGQNLLLSLVLRPDWPSERISLLPLAAGLAASSAIDPYVAPAGVRLKWPNDLFLGERKCGGILVESVYSGNGKSTPDSVILGIGINVNQAHFPEPIASTATSLLLETGRFTPRAELLASLLSELEAMYESVDDDERRGSLIADYEARLCGNGEAVSVGVVGSSDVHEGIVEGVTESGALRLRTPAGVETLHAGEVTFRQASPR